MSFEVISRLTGGPNLMPRFSVNVYVLPPFVGLGIDVARSGTSLFPAATGDVVVAHQGPDEQVRVDRDEFARYSPVGSKLSDQPNVDSQPTRYVPPLALCGLRSGGRRRDQAGCERGGAENGRERHRDPSSHDLHVALLPPLSRGISQ